MNNFKKQIAPYILIAINQLIIGIGAAFLVASDMGNEPVGVFFSGVSKQTGLSFGTVTTLFNVGFFFAFLIFYRKRISITTLISASCVGLLIDGTVELLLNANLNINIVKYIFPFIGVTIVGIFIASTLALDLGASVADNIILAIGDITKKGYTINGYIFNGLFFTIGLLLGGTFGYATIVSFILTSIIIEFSIPKFKKLHSKNGLM